MTLKMLDKAFHPRIFAHFHTLVVQRPGSLQTREDDLGITTYSVLAIDALQGAGADVEDCVCIILINDGLIIVVLMNGYQISAVVDLVRILALRGSWTGCTSATPCAIATGSIAESTCAR
jgi:hypothetical protein